MNEATSLKLKEKTTIIKAEILARANGAILDVDR